LSADQELYRTFSSIVSSNGGKNNPITSPFLIDTNNLAPKLTNLVVNLMDAKASGRLGNIGLGMTMEQVVGIWGKPRAIWPRCFGGVLFSYKDVSVIFESGSNSVLSFLSTFSSPSHHFTGGLSASSTIPDFVRVLGNPSAQYNKGASSLPREELVYVTPAATLRLGFADDTLWNLRLDRPGVEHSNGKMVPLRLSRPAKDDARRQ
jgi:hypothetical protein